MRMARSDYDSLALGVMLGGGTKAQREVRLSALRQRAACDLGEECPACGAREGIEDNGCSGSQLVNLCVGCGHQWGPGTEA